jgi:aryl carrier-like protein
MSLEEYAVAVLGPTVDPSSLATHSFIGLGGDSLRAMRLAALVKEEAGLRISVAELLSATPLATVLAGVDGVAGQANGGREDGPTGLTPTQRGMWMIEKVIGGSMYNLVFTCFVERGSLARDTFERAVAATTARHTGLRTLFQEQDGEVTPVVSDRHTPEIIDVEHDGAPGEFDAVVRAAAVEHGRLPFDLAAAPAVRFVYLTNPAGRTAVVLVAHHMVLDGWAVGLLLREVFAHYDALARNAPPPFTGPAPSVRSLISRQDAARHSGEWEGQAEFWLENLDGVPTTLELPSDRPRPAIQDPSGERVPLDLGAELSAAVTDRARELGITRFAFLLGAYALALSRWTDAHRLLVGVSLYGRDTAELAELIGVAGNLIPVRIDVDDDVRTADFLHSVQESLARSIYAGALPFDELISRLGVERSLSAHPLVQACFGMHDELVPHQIHTGAATIRVEEGHGGGAQFDLSLLFGRSTPSLAGQLEYATSVWSRADADGFLADFTAAAAELTVARDNPVLEELRCLSTERRAVLAKLNDTRRDFPAATVDELFRDVVRRTPDAVAVREGDVELTYAQLAGAAAEQARHLREAGVMPGDRVLVGLERSIAETVAVLGVVWAGAAYVGVDLSQPAAHLAKIVTRAAPAAALVPAQAANIPAEHGIPTCATWRPSWPSADDPTAAAVDPARLAYVAFTSGSTGVPKGVGVPHRAAVRLVHEADYVRLGRGERVLRLSPLAFDASTLEI